MPFAVAAGRLEDPAGEVVGIVDVLQGEPA